jgi:polyisoprenyl-phosphate glycosyltransferase
MMDNSIKFSIISPVYGAAKLLPELIQRIHAAVSGITDNYEIILVEDNSRDDSWDVICRLAADDDKIVGISLSRNFGQQHALNAGFDQADGDWIVTLDCDLQDEPERIADLYNEALKGYDIVFASRVDRKDGLLKIMGSRLFYKLLGYLTETEQDHSIANFVLYRSTVVKAMATLGDYHKYYPMLNKWVGFRTIKLPIKHAARKDNKKSSYSIKKRLRLAFSTIVAFSDKPLRLVLKLGISLVTLSFIFALILVIRYIASGEKVSGWVSLFLSVWILSGFIIIILGLLGTYIGKIFETVKNRPTYIIREKIKKKENEK